MSLLKQCLIAINIKDFLFGPLKRDVRLNKPKNNFTP